MGEAAKAWMAAVEDPSRLIVENERLRKDSSRRSDIIESYLFAKQYIIDNKLTVTETVEDSTTEPVLDVIHSQRLEIERLKKERDHWRANHDNQVKLKAAIADRPDLGDRANRVTELVAEIERLKSDISDYEIEMRERSDVAENLARELNTERMQRKEFEALAKSLEKELDAAPKWVSVAEFESSENEVYVVFNGRHISLAENHKEFGWMGRAVGGINGNATHVLANLRPPVTRQWPLLGDPRGDGDFEPKVSMSANELDVIVDGWDSDDWKVVVGNDQRIVADAFDKMIAVTKSAEEDAIRERLMQPFLGSEAEKLGATSYKLRDGERWMWEHFQRGWADCFRPVWSKNLRYRLAAECKHEHIKTIPGTPYDVYSIECADCGKVVS